MAGQGLIDMARFDACLQGTTSCENILQGVMADCFARREACQSDASPAGYSDDLRLTIAAMNDAGRAQVPASLALDCSSIGTCLRGLDSCSY